MKIWADIDIQYEYCSCGQEPTYADIYQYQIYRFLHLEKYNHTTDLFSTSVKLPIILCCITITVTGPPFRLWVCVVFSLSLWVNWADCRTDQAKLRLGFKSKYFFAVVFRLWLLYFCVLTVSCVWPLTEEFSVKVWELLSTFFKTKSGPRFSFFFPFVQ